METVLKFKRKPQFEIAGDAKALETAKAELKRMVIGDSQWHEITPKQRQRLADEHICFARDADKNAKACHLHMGHYNLNQMRLMNITPQEKLQDIEEAEYNFVSHEFFNRFVKCLNPSEVITHLPETEFGIEDILSKSAVRKLELFTLSANECSGTSSSFDQPLWHDFIFAVLTSACGDAFKPYIKEWFMANDWDAEGAQELAIEFEKDLASMEFCRQELARQRD